MEQAKQRIEAFADELAQDQELQERFAKDPIGSLRTVAAAQVGTPLRTDVWIYRIVVAALGGAVVLAVVGAIILAASKVVIPEILLALGSAAVGALAGLLAPTPSNNA